MKQAEFYSAPMALKQRSKFHFLFNQIPCTHRFLPLIFIQIVTSLLSAGPTCLTQNQIPCTPDFLLLDEFLGDSI
jgi:hypothetical protein